MADVISTVGTFKTATSTSAAVTSLAVSPASVGNCLVVWAYGSSTSSLHYTGISGGGVTTWTLIESLGTGFPAVFMWFGPVTTAGSSTITFTDSGTLNLGSWVAAQEFGTAGGSALTVWTIDGTQIGTKSNASSTTMTYPTLTPGGPNRLYAGSSAPGQTASGTGQTAGYTIQLGGGVAAGTVTALWDSSVANSAQTPTSLQSPASTSTTMAGLITATNPSGSPKMRVTNFGALQRAFTY